MRDRPDPPDWQGILRETLHELDRAYAALGDAGDWLRSDPTGGLPAGAADARRAVLAAISDAKERINEAKWEARRDPTERAATEG